MDASCRMNHCNPTCDRDKVHLMTVHHAEAPSHVAQGTGVRGLWTVIIHDLPQLDVEENILARGKTCHSTAISRRVQTLLGILFGLDYRLPESTLP